MNDKSFYRLLAAVVAVGILVTAAHLIWAIDAYQSCSIIYFIGKELW